MRRRHFSVLVGAAVAGLVSGSRAAAQATAGEEQRTAKHVCKGLNECKGQGGCAHGCSGNGCHGRNDCKGKGGCAAEAAKHGCKGKNTCKAIGGCTTGDKGCAGRNSCKGRGGCEVPLRIEHTKARERKAGGKAAPKP